MHVDELLKLAKKGKFDEVEAGWVLAAGEAEADLELLLAVPQILVDRGQRELAETLLWYLVDALREQGRPERALAAARRGGELLPGSDVLRGLLADLYGELHGHSDDVGDLLRLTLGSEDLPLDTALVALETLMALRPGCYVLDRQRGVVGRVRGVDAERGGAVVEFADGEKCYGPKMLGRLEPAEDDDFRALSAFERDRLVALAESDPQELVRLALTTLDRRMALRRLRLYLEPIVGSWSKWWSRARDMLRRSADIGMTAGGSPSLFLRAKPLTHGERLKRRFDSAEDLLGRLATALHVVREAAEPGRVEPEVVGHVARELAALARSRQADAGPLALAAAAVAEAAARSFGGGESAPCVGPDAAIEALREPEEFVAAVADPQVLACTLEFVRRLAPPGWQDALVAAMPLMSREGCEAAARALSAEGAEDAVAQGRRELLARPESHAGALAWLWRDSAAGRADEVDAAAVLIQVLTKLTGLVRDADLTEAQRKERIAELRSALFLRGGAALGDVLAAARPEQLVAVKALSERNPALTDAMQADLAKALRQVRPALFEKAVPPYEENVVYTTPAGVAKRKADLEQIAHVRLPQVIREIGQAAGFGDVSDNAEYQSAVQERARLAERAARIQEEIAEARLITPELAAADHVTVGSRVRARNLDSGQEESFTFLGPWDADVERGIYAYNAPLGRAFMGKGVGQTATFRMGTDERRWEILAVEPGV
ncbi:MAG: hypothetical protein AMK73_06595 [Planctomycetes bacterium SM23_32]|nr:MAG: hypothetical protein AMK73_06595 [Planctomycetes bacterium SM23_32]